MERQAVHERDLIVAKVESKPIDAHNVRKRVWAPALCRAGLPYRKFHALRHSCASLLLAAGEPVPNVAKQLGHASIRMTLDVYAHFVPSGQSSGATLSLANFLQSGKVLDSYRCQSGQEVPLSL